MTKLARKGSANSELVEENSADSLISGEKHKTQKSKLKTQKAEESLKADPEEVAVGAGDDDIIKDGAEPEAEALADDGSTINELAAERDKYLRLAAEYDNYRKRSSKEREMTYSDARADTITRLLPVYDNLERALKMECADEAFFKGVEMTMTGLTEILEGMDVRRIEAVGEPFDPNRHNAVMSIENPELGEKIVAEEFQKGFMLGERVIRFSTVVVAN